MSGKDGGFAFPLSGSYISSKGMSLRDWFAGKMMLHYMRERNPGDGARMAYEAADAMLAERDKAEK